MEKPTPVPPAVMVRPGVRGATSIPAKPGARVPPAPNFSASVRRLIRFPAATWSFKTIPPEPADRNTLPPVADSGPLTFITPVGSLVPASMTRLPVVAVSAGATPIVPRVRFRPASNSSEAAEIPAAIVISPPDWMVSPFVTLTGALTATRVVAWSRILAVDPALSIAKLVTVSEAVVPSVPNRMLGRLPSRLPAAFPPLTTSACPDRTGSDPTAPWTRAQIDRAVEAERAARNFREPAIAAQSPAARAERAIHHGLPRSRESRSARHRPWPSRRHGSMPRAPPRRLAKSWPPSRPARRARDRGWCPPPPRPRRRPPRHRAVPSPPAPRRHRARSRSPRHSSRGPCPARAARPPPRSIRRSRSARPGPGLRAHLGAEILPPAETRSCTSPAAAAR